MKTIAFRLAFLTALLLLGLALTAGPTLAQDVTAAVPAAPAFTYGPYEIPNAISQWCQWNAGYEQCFDVPPNPPTVRWTNGCKQVRLTYDAGQAFDGKLTVYGYFDGPSQPYEDLRATVNGVTSDWYDSASVGEGWHEITLPATYHFDAGANYIYLTHPQYPYPQDCDYWGSIHFTDPTETEIGWFALGDPAPAPPINTGPADGSQYCAPEHPNVTLHWTCSGDDCYVQLARDSGFTNLVASYGWTTETSWDVTSYVQTGGTYWWRVKARKGIYEGSYNGPWSFTVVTPTYVSGTISSDTTWPYHFCPYYELTDDVIVNPLVTLTIEPGVVVMGCWSTELRVEGYLSAMGTVERPILFTSALDSGSPQWSGLIFDGGSGNLEHVTVRYGGHTGTNGASGNITARNVPPSTLRIASSQVVSSTGGNWGLYVADSHVVVSDTLFSDLGWFDALHATGASTFLTITDAIFQNNRANALYADGGTLVVSNTTFQDNGGYGLYATNAVNVWLSDSSFSRGSYPLRVAPFNLDRALASNSFTDNTPNRLLTGGGALVASLDFPGSTGLVGIELDGDLAVPAAMRLTLAPGQTVKGGSGTELRIEGYLSAMGTVERPILFTSALDSGPYQWSGLIFDGGSGNLEHVTVRYGGHPGTNGASGNITARNVPPSTLRIASSQVVSSTGGNWGLYVADSHVVVSDTLFSDVGWFDALHATGASTFLTITDAIFQNNRANALYADGGTLVVSNTIFQDNGGYGLYLSGVDAAKLTGNTIQANGGGVYLNNSDAALAGNVIRDNYAANGGGLYVAGDSRPALVNNVLLANRAGSAGSGLYVAGSARPALLHTTLAGNSGGDGSGVYVAAGAAAIFTNTIVYSHTLGVRAAAGAAVTMANTLWDANAGDFAGTVVETGRVTGPAAFTADGYRLGPGSVALERGLDAGVSDDLDGESRPQPAGSPPDLGADESPLAPPVAATVQPTTPITVTLPHGDGELALPAGLVTTTTTFTYTEMLTPTQATGSFAFAGRSFTLVATDSNGNPVTTFAGRYTITLNYSDADWQAAGIPAEENLNLFYRNGSAWVGILPCDGCSLDTVNNRITAVLDHLTEFALLGNSLAAPAVTANKGPGGLELRWTQTQAGVVRYEVYRGTNPYFTAEGGQKLSPDVDPPGVGAQATFIDATAFAQPLTNYYYLVLAVGAEEARSPASNRVGSFHFGLTPGAVSR